MSSEQPLHDASEHLTTDYIAASVNRFERAAHCSKSSLVAFGSSKFVALWRANENCDTGVSQTLEGHEGVVTCVHFSANGQCLLSSDDKGYLRSWRPNLQGSKYYSSGVVQAHKSSLSALATYDSNVVTGSSDGSIAIWKQRYSNENKKDTFDLIQRISLNRRYPFDIQISHLPGSENLIMAVAATDEKIRIFVRSGEEFVQAAALPGHQDWVKSLAFQYGVMEPSILTLASGSQDNTIRLWNIERLSRNRRELSGESVDGTLIDELLDSFEASLGDVSEGDEGGKQISLKRHVITVRNNEDGSATQYSITFDALLVGHEASVTSISWRPSKLDQPQRGNWQFPMLLSTSTDSSVIMWAPSSLSPSNRSDSIWINQQRFGDIGGQRFGGFVGALWSRDGLDALAWGWTGDWRRWRSTSLKSDASDTMEVWEEINAISGHQLAVRSISWSPGGEYLISTGVDRTTRIHANVSQKKSETREYWHEISRPQVHGYELVDAVFLTPTRFVSIAEEKVARVFEAPQSFVTFCKNFDILSDEVLEQEESRPIAASVPPLGLSNKALSEAGSAEAHFPLPSVNMTLRRPFQGELAVSTLWPEVEKIFGHGYELYAIAASHSGKYIATSCRATSAEHAGIRIYDTETWQQFGETLEGHQLTVTRIAFSPDDRYILSVSRDRTWRQYQFSEAGYTGIAADRSHTRIIWDCAWAEEGDVFATASRDKTVKIWPSHPKPEKQSPLATLKMPEAVTAVSFAPALKNGLRLLAMGLETGDAFIYVGMIDEVDKWSQKACLKKNVGHTNQVQRIAWRPQNNRHGKENRLQLGTCSEDGTVRILGIEL